MQTQSKHPTGSDQFIDKETILVVEDDTKLREYVACELRYSGFNVLEAASAEEALPLVVTNKNIDLLFSDLTLPNGMSGLELSQRLNETHPHISILLTSGYANMFLSGMDTKKVPPIVHKPFTMNQLRDKIMEAIESK